MEEVIIGIIAKSYQIKGEVKIRSNTDFAKKRFKKDAKVIVYNKDSRDKKELTIESYRNVAGIDIIKFKEYNNPEDVSKLQGYQILIEKPQDKINKGEYYYADLFGMDAYVNDKFVGKIDDIIDTGANKILRIKRDNKNDLLYPFVSRFIENVDVENKKIILLPIDGMID